jgi:hypothetical protein
MYEYDAVCLSEYLRARLPHAVGVGGANRMNKAMRCAEDQGANMIRWPQASLHTFFGVEHRLCPKGSRQIHRG